MVLARLFFCYISG